jgi:hypothetical protein
MMESISHSASLVAQVIEDVSYEPLDYQLFQAELEGIGKAPHYKDDGYFAFSDLAPGSYLLRIAGERFQTQHLPVTIPSAPIVFDPAEGKMQQLLARIVFDQAGDNELVVVAKTVNAPNKRITFDAAAIPRPINAGAAVVANGLTTKLATKLDAGSVASVRLDSVAGITPDSIVRIVRDRSIRLRFDPYYQTPAELTRIVGRVTLKDQPEIVLEGAGISLTRVGGASVSVADVGGAKIATAIVGVSKVVLGTERDLQTFANGKGDYNLYFTREDVPNVTLEAALAGFQTASATLSITPRTRIRADFELQKT